MPYAHDAQVMLYQLLMEERYGTSINTGVLWNLHEARPELVSRSVGEPTTDSACQWPVSSCAHRHCQQPLHCLACIPSLSTVLAQAVQLAGCCSLKTAAVVLLVISAA